MRFYVACVLLTSLLACGCIQEDRSIGNLKDLGPFGGSEAPIPRKVLFGSPDKDLVKISPDGSRISYLAPVNGTINLWVKDAENDQRAYPVTRETQSNMSDYAWAYTNQHLLYVLDRQRNQNWRVFCLNLSSAKTRDLTPFGGIRAQLLKTSPKYPREIVVSLNERDPQHADIYKVDIETGEISLLQENPGFDGFEIDDDFQIRLAYKDTPEGGREFYRPSGKEWIPLLHLSAIDLASARFLGFDGSRQAAYFADSRDADTSGLYSLDLRSGERNLIFENPKADLTDAIIHPSIKKVQAAAFTYDRKRWRILDESIANDLLYLNTLDKGEVQILGRSEDDRYWLAAHLPDDGAAHYYYYDRGKETARFLFADKGGLEGYRLTRMIPVIIISQDGLNLVGYYSLPPECDQNGDNLPDKPVPMVLYVHDGPWMRDSWGFNPVHQWLANRGYAVLSVNYRGSAGFGKSFMDAGNREWGGKMQQDLTDAVNWSVRAGIADPKRIAVMGEGYGGYATLAALAYTPDLFVCGVDIEGPPDLITYIQSFNGQPESLNYAARVGDIQTNEGVELLKNRSPIYSANNITKPLLIFQAGLDKRVNPSETEKMAQSLKDSGGSVTYVLYPQEERGISGRGHARSLYAIAESFLAEHLGGRCEPFGTDLQGAALEVPLGAEGVPGLESALRQ